MSSNRSNEKLSAHAQLVVVIVGRLHEKSSTAMSSNVRQRISLRLSNKCFNLNLMHVHSVEFANLLLCRMFELLMKSRFQRGEIICIYLQKNIETKFSKITLTHCMCVSLSLSRCSFFFSFHRMMTISLAWKVCHEEWCLCGWNVFGLRFCHFRHENLINRHPHKHTHTWREKNHPVPMNFPE